MSNIHLQIGDKIGFVRYAAGIDDTDRTNFFPVVEVTTRDGERAYNYQYPDGSRSSAAITQSALQFHTVELQQAINPRMICLNNRKDEFRAALKRGLSNEMEVYADFERDSFVVVNKTNKTEYRVSFETRGAKTFALCNCPDFSFRKNLCKHVAEVLSETFFGAVEAFGVSLES